MTAVYFHRMTHYKKYILLLKLHVFCELGIQNTTECVQSLHITMLELPDKLEIMFLTIRFDTVLDQLKRQSDFSTISKKVQSIKPSNFNPALYCS